MRPRGRTAMSPLQGNGKERFSEILDAAALVFQEHAFDIAMQWRPEFAPGYARRTDQRPTVGSSCSEYRAPCTVTLERLRSMSRRSSGVRLISAALMFCSRRSSFVVPGIGTIYCFCAQVTNRCKSFFAALDSRKRPPYSKRSCDPCYVRHARPSRETTTMVRALIDRYRNNGMKRSAVKVLREHSSLADIAYRAGSLEYG